MAAQTKDYRLNVLSIRKFTKDEEGNRRAKVYRRGDKIPLEQEDADRLLKDGSVTLWSEAPEEEKEAPEATGDAPVAPAAVSGQTADPVLTEGGEEATVEDPNAEPGGGGGDAADTHDDGYDDLDYPALQKAAKDRGLNAGGSAEDIKARLREDDSK